MTTTPPPPVHEIKLSALAPKDAWTLHSTNGSHRLTIAPQQIEVVGFNPFRGADLLLYVSVSGRLIRQSDGQVTGVRRSVSFRFDDDETPQWIANTLGEAHSLDPELRAFALDARNRIRAALATAVLT